jgi:hypothetical protein
MPKRVLAAVGTMLLTLAAAASAQDVPVIKVKIDHPFVVMGETLPAGEYKLTYDSSGSFAVDGPDKDSVAFAAVETRLSGPDEHVNIPEPRLVFDVTGDIYTLSEIWVPNQAGFLISSEQRPHEHSTTRAHR